MLDDYDDDDVSADAGQPVRTSAQPPANDQVLLGSGSKASAPQAEAPGRHVADLGGSSESDREAARESGRHASTAKLSRLPWPQYTGRPKHNQPRYMPPAKRPSGSRAEEAVRLAAASFQASPSRTGPSVQAPAAAAQAQGTSDMQEGRTSNSSPPQPYFMATDQSMHSSPARNPQRAAGYQGPQSHLSIGHQRDAPGIGADLSALLRHARGSGDIQPLPSLTLPGMEAERQEEPGAGLPAPKAVDAGSEAMQGAAGSQDSTVQEMALAAAAAGREAVAALSSQLDSPRSPAAGAGPLQQPFQPDGSQEQGSEASLDAWRADVGPRGAKREVPPAVRMCSKDHEGAPARSQGQSVSSQTPLQPNLLSGKPQRSASGRGRGGSQGSKGRGQGVKASIGTQKDQDSLTKQRNIRTYFSPRAKT